MIRIELEKLFELALLNADSEEMIDQLIALKAGKDSIILPDEFTDEDADPEKVEQSLFVFLQNCTIPQKIKLALYGNKSVRTALVRDSNKQIPAFVLQNPGLTEGEVQEFARNTNLDEGVFRTISYDATWMKSYTVKLNLVSNPKVPIDVSLRWAKFLQERDLKKLSKSKNIPQVLATQCSKLVEKKEPGGG